MKIYSVEEGNEMLKAARSAVELSLRSPRFTRDIVERSISHLDAKESVFVRFLHNQTKTPRGSKAVLEKPRTLNIELVDSALASARSGSLSYPELEHVIVEVSIIQSVDRLMGSPTTKLRNFALGEDGLIIEYGTRKAVMLPHDALEGQLGKNALFQKACESIGLPKELWKQQNLRLYKFKAQTFIEGKPNGNAVKLS